MFASLNISSIINLFFTFSMILLVYFYLKKRLDCVENKVDIMFNLIQEHQKQIKMQEIMNTNNACNKGFCNVSDFSLPMSKDNECNENVNDDGGESENSDTESDDENDTDDETDDLSQDVESNNMVDVVDIDSVDKNGEEQKQEEEQEQEQEQQEQEESDVKENTNDEVNETSLAENDVVEPTEQNVNNWTQNSEGDNITVLEDNNNNKIKISIVKNIDSNIDYSKLKVQELKKLASERNIVGYSSLKKKELIKLLE